MADATIRAVITARDDASMVVSGFGKALDGAGLSFGKLSLAFAAGQAIFDGVTTALSGVASFLGDTITQAESLQNAEVGLQNAINNNTGITDKSTESLIKNASAPHLNAIFAADAHVHLR